MLTDLQMLLEGSPEVAVSISIGNDIKIAALKSSDGLRSTIVLFNDKVQQENVAIEIIGAQGAICLERTGPLIANGITLCSVAARFRSADRFVAAIYTLSQEFSLSEQVEFHRSELSWVWDKFTY